MPDYLKVKWKYQSLGALNATVEGGQQSIVNQPTEVEPLNVAQPTTQEPASLIQPLETQQEKILCL